MAGLASVGLIVAIINILNLILARVLRRTKSIGLSWLWEFPKNDLPAVSFGVPSFRAIGAGVGVGLSLGLSLYSGLGM